MWLILPHPGWNTGASCLRNVPGTITGWLYRKCMPDREIYSSLLNDDNVVGYFLYGPDKNEEIQEVLVLPEYEELLIEPAPRTQACRHGKNYASAVHAFPDPQQTENRSLHEVHGQPDRRKQQLLLLEIRAGRKRCQKK